MTVQPVAHRPGPRTPAPRVRSGVAVALVTLLVVPYAAFFAVAPTDAAALLEPVFGLAAIGVLVLAGAAPRTELFLRAARPSRAGLATLAVVTVLLVPVLTAGTWRGWSAWDVLVLAPVSGVAQELYFRASLLPALRRVLAPRTALVVHAVVFTAWHARTFAAMGRPGAIAVTATVLFLAGLGWGSQAARDRTVVWTTVQHTAFLMLMGLFAFG